jgi:hypothetical protein
VHVTERIEDRGLLGLASAIFAKLASLEHVQTIQLACSSDSDALDGGLLQAWHSLAVNRVGDSSSCMLQSQLLL